MSETKSDVDCPLKEIRQHQNGLHFRDKDEKLNLEQNYVLKVLDAQGWRDLITKILSLPSINYNQYCPRAGNKIPRSAIFTLAHLVQANMLTLLKNLLVLAIHRTQDHDDLKPVIIERDISLGLSLLALSKNCHFRYEMGFILGSASPVSPVYFDLCPEGETRGEINKIIEEDTKKRIIWHLLRESGNIDVEDEGVTDELWVFLIGLTGSLLHKALEPGDFPRCTPGVEAVSNRGATVGKCLNAITSTSVEIAARTLGLPWTKVYGIMPVRDEEEDCEIFSDDEVSTLSNEDQESEDCNSMSSSDEDDGDDDDSRYSWIYHSDKDCPDGENDDDDGDDNDEDADNDNNEDDDDDDKEDTSSKESSNNKSDNDNADNSDNKDCQADLKRKSSKITPSFPRSPWSKRLCSQPSKDCMK